MGMLLNDVAAVLQEAIDFDPNDEPGYIGDEMEYVNDMMNGMYHRVVLALRLIKGEE